MFDDEEGALTAAVKKVLSEHVENQKQAGVAAQAVVQALETRGEKATNTVGLVKDVLLDYITGEQKALVAAQQVVGAVRDLQNGVGGR